jgi:hypothetical protein
MQQEIKRLHATREREREKYRVHAKRESVCRVYAVYEKERERASKESGNI